MKESGIQKVTQKENQEIIRRGWITRDCILYKIDKNQKTQNDEFHLSSHNECLIFVADVAPKPDKSLSMNAESHKTTYGRKKSI